MTVIDTRGLTKKYPNGVTGIENLTLQVKRGEIFGFLGPNGAGKTTTVRLLNGTLKPTGGSYSVLGLNTDPEEVRMRTSTLAEEARMYEHLSVMENLQFFACLYDLDSETARKRILELLAGMELWEKRDLKLGSFSTGMKKRVYLVRTLLHRPELIFLDEPTSGLDPANSRQVVRLIKRLAEEHGTTIFLCTHNLPLAEEICGSYGFVSSGRLVIQGTRDELINSVRSGVRVLLRTDRGEERKDVDTEEDVHGIVVRAVDEGRKVYEVRQERPSLEEVYFHYVGEDKNELE